MKSHSDDIFQAYLRVKNTLDNDSYLYMVNEDCYKCPFQLKQEVSTEI